MPKYLLIISSIVLIYSCKQSATKGTTKSTTLKQPAAVSHIRKEDPPGIDTVGSVYIDFGEFRLQMPDIEIYRDDSIPGKDTIEISPELGYELDSQIVIVHLKPNIKRIEIFESYKTVLSITDEGPHLDLYDWKGYESSWTASKPLTNKAFMMRFIPEKEAARFPKFTREELIKVAESVDKAWGNTLKKPSYGTWKDHYWIGVGIRRLKFVLTDSEGKSFEKYLVAYMPMGC